MEQQQQAAAATATKMEINTMLEYRRANKNKKGVVGPWT